VQNATLIHDLDFQTFEGFSCYYNPSPLPLAASLATSLATPLAREVAASSAAWSRPAVAHQQVEILILFENAVAKLVWQSAQEQQQKTIAAGQICIIPHHQAHQLTLNQLNLMMVIHITPQLIIEATHETLRTPQWTLPGEYGIEDETILALAKSLRPWLDETGAIANLYRKTLVKMLAVHLIAQYAQADFKQAGDISTVDDAKLAPILEYIHNNLDTDLKVSALAEIAELSQSHFCRVFKKSVGLSPYRYILSQRIAQAKALLVETALGLADISFQCGFYDQSHFILQFRRFTGITPKTYREQAISAEEQAG